MQITQISQDFSVSPQITTADVTEIANAGFKSIICNRPDFEEPTQPVFNDIASAAHDAGLKTAHVPITTMPMPAYPNCRNPFLPIVAAEIAPQSCFTPQTASASE